MTIDDTNIEFESDIALINYLEEQNSLFIPNINFPIYNNDKPITDTYNLYEILNECEPEIENCDNISITSNKIEENTYKFNLATNAEEISNIEWLIDGELQNGENSTEFTKELITNEDRTFEICSLAYTNNCSESSENCTTVEINVHDCNDIEFEYSIEYISSNDFEYYEVIAQSSLIENENSSNIEYEWIIDSNTVEVISDYNTRDFQFQAFDGFGTTIQLCLNVFTPNCPDGTTFCENIPIPTVID